MRHFRGIPEHFSIYFIGGVIVSLSQILLFPFLARRLGPEQLGVLELANATLGLLIPVLGVGLAPTIGYFFIRRTSPHDFANRIFQMLIIAITAWVFILPMLWITHNEILNSILGNILEKNLFALLIGIAATQLLNDIFLNTLRMNQNALFKVFIESGGAIAIAGTSVLILIYSHQPISHLFLVKLLIGGLIAILGVGAAFRHLKGFKPSFGIPDSRIILKISAPFLLSTTSAWALNASDRIILAKYVSLSELAFYSLGNRLAAAWELFIISAILSAVVPKLYERYRDNSRDATILNQRILKNYLIGSTIVYVLALITSAQLFPLFFGTQFQEACTYFLISLIGYIFIGAFSFVSQQAHYMGKSYLVISIYLFCGLISIVCNLYLVPQYGPLAAAITGSSCQILMFILGLVLDRTLKRQLEREL